MPTKRAAAGDPGPVLVAGGHAQRRLAASVVRARGAVPRAEVTLERCVRDGCVRDGRCFRERRTLRPVFEWSVSDSWVRGAVPRLVLRHLRGQRSRPRAQ